MTRRCFRAAFASGIAFLSLAMLSVPARADLIVFDPTNFSQNVLTAARERHRPARTPAQSRHRGAP